MHDLMIWLLLVDALALAAMVIHCGGFRRPELMRVVARTTRPRSRPTPPDQNRSR